MGDSACPRCGSDTCPGRDDVLACAVTIDGLTARQEATKALARLGPYMDAIDHVEVAVRVQQRPAMVYVNKVDGRWVIEARSLHHDTQRLLLARQTLIDAGYFTEDEVGDDVAPRISEMLFAIRDGKWDVRAAFGRDPEDGTAAPAAYLTPEEHRIMDLTADLANTLHAVIHAGGDERVAAADWNEAVLGIHHVQHTVLAQAAARAYPDRYRLAGRTLVKTEEVRP